MKINSKWGATADSLFQLSIDTENRRLRERYAALAMLASGLSARQVAARIGRRRQTVTDWLRLFNEHGPSGLTPHFQSASTPLLTSEEFGILKEALAQSPAVYGFAGSRWRGWQIAEYIEKVSGKAVHPETARRYKKRLMQ